MAPACLGSELRGGGGRRRQRLPSPGSQGTLAPAPLPPGGAQMAPLCSCSEQRGRRVSSPPQPTPASVPAPARPVPMSICQQVRSSVHQLPGCPRRVRMPCASREMVLAPSEFAEFTGEKGVVCHGAEGEGRAQGHPLIPRRLWGTPGCWDCPRPHRHIRGPEERGPLPSRSLGSSRREASVPSTHSVREPLFIQSIHRKRPVVTVP